MAMPRLRWRLCPTTKRTIWVIRLGYQASNTLRIPRLKVTMLQTSTAQTVNERELPALKSVSVERLTNSEAAEVLNFLSRRPIHTIAMTGLINDNGIVSPFNRGTFYSCRDLNGQLEGVALVGHATLMETVSDRALAALAQVARECPNTHLIMGEKERVADFWNHYTETGRKQRLACREWLFELTLPAETREPIAGLRRATADELELVMPVQAELAYAESGINPMKVDPEGFRMRCL